MKKTICLFIVLAMVSVADAAVIDVRIVSLNGEAIPPTKEITIAPGDVVDFQITFNAPTSEYLFALGVKMNVSGPASFFWPDIGIDCWPCCSLIEECPDIHPSFDGETCAHGYDWICAGATAKGVRGTGEEIWVAKGLFLQCDGIGDVYLWLSDYTPCGGGTKVIDINYNEVPHQYGVGVIIHQLPACWQCPGQPFGDADGDGFVGTTDLLILKRSWLKSASDPHGTGMGQYNCCADFTQDGIVNTSDLLKLKQGWMTVHFPCDDISCP